jgi:hypothetical protein
MPSPIEPNAITSVTVSWNSVGRRRTRCNRSASDSRIASS